MGIIPTELDKSINNEDLLSDKNHRKHTHTHTQTLTHALIIIIFSDEMTLIKKNKKLKIDHTSIAI